MFYISKEVEISAAHSLDLNYESPCKQLHGHNWKIKLYFKNETLNEHGMIADFTFIKKTLKEKFDHRNLNTIYPFTEYNSTAENMACHICTSFQSYGCYRVEVTEVDGSWACYDRS